MVRALDVSTHMSSTQLLDAVHQLIIQFPNAFEFTSSLLSYVALAAYSGASPAFTSDSERARRHAAEVGMTRRWAGDDGGAGGGRGGLA